MTRLSKDYKNIMINKIKNNFTDNQQNLFIASFYCYLNYDTKKDFVVDFNNVWKWLGFSRKDNAKRLLEKFFTIDIDFKVVKLAPPMGGASFDTINGDQKFTIDIDTDFKVDKTAPPLGGAVFDTINGGQNKEQIMLTINTFKKFCLKAGTKKAEEVHDYYIKLEELLQETINEENDELRLQLTNKEEKLEIAENLIEKYDKNNIELSKKYNKIYLNHQFYLKRKELYKLKKGNSIYLINMKISYGNNDIQRIKVGNSSDITNRVSGFRTSNPFCEVLFVMYTYNSDIVEKVIKTRYEKFLEPNNSEFITNVNYTEIKESLLSIATILNCEYTIETDEELEKFNKHIIQEDEVIDDEKIVAGMKRCGGLHHETEESRKLYVDNFFKNKSNKDGYARLCKECYLIGQYGDQRKRRKVITVPEYDTITHKWCNLCEIVKEHANFYSV